MTPLLVAVGAAVGATLRFYVAHHLDDRTPWGTLLVNLAGSFALGVVAGADVSAEAVALLATGFCGGLTTYSAFAVQTRDQTARSARAGAVYAAVTVVGAVGACAVGFAVTGR